MAITKRLRFEILRRDGHTCQYCGGKAPDVTLHVDHLIPVALGGSNKPDNLVAACKDCNLGKSSMPADAPILEAVGAQAAAYALEMVDKMTTLRANFQESAQYIDDFDAAWKVWFSPSTSEPSPRPVNWRASIRRWHGMGVPFELLDEAIEIAMVKPGLKGDYPKFSYMAGIIWRRLNDIRTPDNLSEQTVRTFTQAEVDEALDQNYRWGWNSGYKKRKEEELAQGQSEHSDGDLV
ncbi:HNH endonuclease [Galactobacter caseinivorans]|uniref:HNH endonuclease n=1 Tax=Galactobacter caseinivorans TaxID=2676123 RepID=A0A496PMK1_9MICC|nr:HNH endonuclease [Galactobacter caseinivorans]RKW71770.1 HNH endonuclease [Galactobacter caseinivorans]